MDQEIVELTNKLLDAKNTIDRLEELNVRTCVTSFHVTPRWPLIGCEVKSGFLLTHVFIRFGCFLLTLSVYCLVCVEKQLEPRRTT